MKLLAVFTNKRFLLAGVIIIGIIAVAGFFAYKNSPAGKDQQAQQELQRTVARVSLIMYLPDETPTMATVLDPEKLKGQAFFANAKKGDQVLIYPNAKKAILYDPVANKIVEVGPVNIGNPAQ